MAAADASRQYLRVQVFNNPYAVAPLSTAFGDGPYDERFGTVEGRVCRTFVGSELQKLETAEKESGVRHSPLDLLRDE